MSGRQNLILASCLIFLTAIPAQAQYAQQCAQAGTAASNHCSGIVQTAGALDAAQAQQQAAGVGSSRTINPGGGAQATQIADQTTRLNQAKSTCQADREQCVSKCQKALQGAQSIQDPGRRASEVNGVKSNQQSKCEAPIDANIAKLDSALGNLGENSSDTGKTQNSSNGGMPQMPQMPEKPPKDDSTAQTPTEPTLNCDAAGFTQYRECVSHYVEKCGGSAGDTTCTDFTNKYCNLSGTNATADVGIQTPFAQAGDGSTTRFSRSQTLQVMRTGEGLGSDYCRVANAAKFCEQSGRGQCPSCQPGGGDASQASVGFLTQAKESCPTDPLFTDPAVQARLSEGVSAKSAAMNEGTSSAGSGSDHFGASGGGGAAGGGGGSIGGAGGGGTATLGNAQSPGGAAPSANGRMPSATAEGGGGGGSGGGDFGGSGSSHGESESSFDRDGKIKPESASNNSGNIAPAIDVSRQVGPNIFSIGSQTYQALCNAGRLRCLAPNPGHSALTKPKRR